MTNRATITLAAALITALAAPAAAQGLVPYYNYSPQVQAQQFHQTQTRRLIEGRNAAAVRDHQSTIRAPLVPDRTEVLGN
jgi:hypothetical protein